jgi:hypothetical protein
VAAVPVRGRAAADWRLSVAVSLVAGSLLGLEVILSRILAVAMWHHFASLVISVALLWTAAGAVRVSLGAGRGGASSAGWLWGPAQLAAASMLALFGLFAAVNRFPRIGYRVFSPFFHPFFEPFSPAAAPEVGSVAGSLAILCTAMGLPFFFGGILLAGVIDRRRAESGAIYAADSAGAGLGCLAAIGLMSAVDGLSALPLAAIPAALAAAIIAPSGARRWLSLLLAVTLAVVGAVNTVLPLARFPFVRGRWQPDIAYEKWDAVSRVVVHPLAGGQEEGAWGQSRLSAHPVPRQLGLVVDDTGFTTISAAPADGDPAFMRDNVIALPYVVRPGARTLLIGPGGGRDLLAARAMGAGPVTAVEINPLVVEAVDRVFGDFSGRPYGARGVETHVADARSFLRRRPERYGVIGASLVYGRLPSSAGAFTLTEEPLYTRQSFAEYLAHLEPDGVLSISRFVFEKRILRLVALARAALQDAGSTEPGRHLFMASERGLATLLVCRRPFEDGELEALRAWCDRLGFEVLHDPGRPGTGPIARLLDPGGGDAYAAGIPADLSPPTDDRPYFYYLVRPGDFWRGIVSGGGGEFEDRALLLVRDALLLLGLLALLLVLLPQARRGMAAGATWPVSAYFASIALGFMTVEILLLKTMSFYLAHPVLSFSLVLSALLLAGGAGSALGGRLVPQRPSSLAFYLAVLAGVVAFYPHLVGWVVDRTLAAPIVARASLAVVMITPLGLLLGIPFPGGIRRLEGRSPGLAAWAMGINGAVSVIGAMLAMLAAVNLGHALAWRLAPAAYLAAMAVSFRLGGPADA